MCRIFKHGKEIQFIPCIYLINLTVIYYTEAERQDLNFTKYSDNISKTLGNL